MLQTLPLYQKQTISFQDTQVLFNGFFLAVTQNLVTCSTSLSQLATLQTLLYVFTFLPLNVFFTYLAGFFICFFHSQKKIFQTRYFEQKNRLPPITKQWK